MRHFAFLGAFGVAISMGTASAACGVETDCTVAGGTYRIDLPEGGVTGAIFFAHGYRGSANGTMRNGNLRRMATGRGLAFVALDAGEDDWALPNAPGARGETDGQTEFDYVAAVVADVTTLHGVPADRLMLSGFSAGGMLVWNVACARPDLFAGFVPVSGTFWLEPPETCSMPAASIIHMHGTTDRTVPLNGRAIGNTRQGRVPDAMTMYQRVGGFDVSAVEGHQMGQLNCGEMRNSDGAILAFCQFEGGHSFSRTYLTMAWDRFADAGLMPVAQ